MKNRMEKAWIEFTGTVIPDEMDPKSLLAFKAAFFAGALSAIEAEREITKIVAKCDPMNFIEAVKDAAQQSVELHNEIFSVCQEIGEIIPEPEIKTFKPENN